MMGTDPNRIRIKCSQSDLLLENKSNLTHKKLDIYAGHVMSMSQGMSKMMQNHRIIINNVK